MTLKNTVLKRLTFKRVKNALVELFPVSDLLQELGLPIILLLVAAASSAALWNEGVFDDLVQQTANDRLLHTSPNDTAMGENIVVLTINDETLSSLQTFQESRDLLFCLASKIAKAQPKTIVFDVVFNQKISRNERGTTKRDCPLGNDVVPNSLTSTGIPTIVGSVVRWEALQPNDVMPDTGVIFREQQNWGHIQIEESYDAAVIRSLQLYYRAQNSLPIPSIALAAWAIGEHGINGKQLRRKISECMAAKECQNELKSVLPTSETSLRIRYTPQEHTFVHIPAHELISGPMADDQLFLTVFGQLLKDKYVVIGSATSRDADVFNTPLNTVLPLTPAFIKNSLFKNRNEQTPGVFVHAYVLSNLLNQNALTVAKDGPYGFLSLVVVIIPPLLFLLTHILFSRIIRNESLRGAVKSIALILLLSGVVIGLYEYAVALLLTDNQVLLLSQYYPLLMLSFTATIFGAAFWNKVGKLEQHELFVRHAGEFFNSSSQEVYASLLKKSTESFALIIHRPLSELELENDHGVGMAETELAYLQNVMSETLRHTDLEGCVPFIDNWSANRIILYVFPEGGDGPAPEMIDPLIDIALQLLTTMETQVKAGHLAIAIGRGRLSLMDVPSRVEDGVLTFGGELLDHLLAKAQADPSEIAAVTFFAVESDQIASSFRKSRYCWERRFGELHIEGGRFYLHRPERKG